MNKIYIQKKRDFHWRFFSIQSIVMYVHMEKLHTDNSHMYVIGLSLD